MEDWLRMRFARSILMIKSWHSIVGSVSVEDEVDRQSPSSVLMFIACVVVYIHVHELHKGLRRCQEVLPQADIVFTGFS